MPTTLDMTRDRATMNDSETLLDIEQAARFLNVSETSLRRWTNDGRLACLRVGLRRERRFRKADLLAFLESEPAGRRRAKDGHGVGTHLCGLYSSEEGRVQQARAFLSAGFPPGSLTLLVGSADGRGRILESLRQEHPDLPVALAEGRILAADYAASSSAQVDQCEEQVTDALRRGVRQVRVLGDAGAFARTASREELHRYEDEYERRISHRFPVVTMCQYDVRLFSGLVLLDALKSHPRSFEQAPERILA